MSDDMGTCPAPCTPIRTVHRTISVPPVLPQSLEVVPVADKDHPDDHTILIDVTNGNMVLTLPASELVKDREFVFRRLDDLANSVHPSVNFEALIEVSIAADFIDFPDYAKKVRLKSPNTGVRLAADPDGGYKILDIFGPNNKLAANNVIDV